MVGTPAWCDLSDHDPAKWAALIDAAQHWALRIETAQEMQCQASQAISESADWTGIARRIRDRDAFRRENAWARRVIV
jgi:hypothetical protein